METETRQFFGRKQIFADTEEITEANVVEVLKMLCLPEGVGVKYLSAAMQQTETQALSDNLYDTVLTICGIPNRDGGSSASDTGSAVIMRNGQESAYLQSKAWWEEQEKKAADTTGNASALSSAR